MKRLLVLTAIILLAIAMAGASSDRQSLSRRNPFAPLGETTTSNKTEFTKGLGRITAPEETSLRLNGIIWNKDNPMAIINDTVVTVGSETAGRKVSAISVEYVELEYQSKKEILRITPKILFSVTSKKSDTKTVSKIVP